jgi:hypothetical protein
MPRLVHATSWKFMLLISTHLHLGLPCGSWTQVSSPKYCMYLSQRYACYTPHRYNSSWFDRPNNIWWGLQIIKLRVMWSSALSGHFLALRPIHLPQHSILEHLSLHSSLNVRDQVSHPYTTTGKITVLCLILVLLSSKLEDKDSAPIESKHSLSSVCSEFVHEWNFD